MWAKAIITLVNHEDDSKSFTRGMSLLINAKLLTLCVCVCVCVCRNQPLFLSERE